MFFRDRPCSAKQNEDFECNKRLGCFFFALFRERITKIIGHDVHKRFIITVGGKNEIEKAYNDYVVFYKEKKNKRNWNEKARFFLGCFSFSQNMIL